MHVLRVSHLFYPDTLSDYLLEFSIRQVSRGHEIDVVTWNKNRRPQKENVLDNLTIYRLPGINFRIRGAITDYPYVPCLPDKIAQLKPEIVHAESHLFLTTVQAIKKAKELHKPSVVTVHGVMAKRSSIINLAQFSYLRTLSSWIFRNADRIICLTQSDAKEIIAYGCPYEKIRIVPNAVDTDRFRPVNGKWENLVVWTGRFVPEKGLNYLIEAARIVKKECRNVKFILVGDGPIKANIVKSAHNYGLLNNVVCFAGPFDRNQIANILSKASLFVLPSLKEGMSLSLLEAMACGKAIIGSSVPGIEDVITDGKNGLLVPAADSEALANAILTLLNDENLSRRLGQMARQLVVEKYSWNIVIDKIEKVYDEVVK
jgi:glycosyltransferase involved in cell wall biosynthesis